MGLFRSDTRFSGLIHDGAYFRGGGRGLYTNVKIVQEYILPCQIYLKKNHIQIYISDLSLSTTKPNPNLFSSAESSRIFYSILKRWSKAIGQEREQGGGIQ